MGLRLQTEVHSSSAVGDSACLLVSSLLALCYTVPVWKRMADKERQAVIVGVGRYTQFPKPVDECVTPVGMFATAARAAAADASPTAGADALLKDLVAVGAPMMFLEMRWAAAFGGEQIYHNFERSVADELGANPADELCWSSMHGGNGPQFMVSSFAELIAEGKIAQGPILVGGVEENSTFDRAVRPGNKEALLEAGWGDAGAGATPDKPPTVVNQHPSPEEDALIERQTGLHVGGGAIHNYAMFENAQAAALGRSADEHAAVFGDLVRAPILGSPALREPTLSPDRAPRCCTVCPFLRRRRSAPGAFMVS